MRFLIDADLPRRTKQFLMSHAHEAQDVRDLPLSTDDTVAAHARTEQLCLITCDFGFADIRNYPPAEHFGIVVLELPKNATADFKLSLVRKFVDEPQVLAKVSGRLAIVAARRIRLRPA